MPKRIQRKRTKGWKMPPNTVYVGRPTKWGNLWRVGQQIGNNDWPMTPEEGVACYRKWIVARDADRERSKRSFDGPYSDKIKTELRGKNLACWCPLDQPCHADVLLEIAND